MLVRQHHSRKGAIIPLVAVCSIALFGMLALAIDVGMIAVARTQTQNAADTAATAGARTLTGDSSIVGNENNHKTAPINAVNAAVNNTIMTKAVLSNSSSFTNPNSWQWVSQNATIDVGGYVYKYDDANPANEKFETQFPKTSTTDPYSAIRATIKSENFNAAFSRVFGATSFNSSATALSVHRPRDVVIIMDLSGSMRFQSLPGIYINTSDVASPSSLSRPRTVSLNPDSSYPKFGHYSNTSAAAFYGNTSYSTGSEMADPANISITTNSGPPIIEDFYTNNVGITPTSSDRAFWPSDLAYDTAPGGDNYLKKSKNTSSSYGDTVSSVLSSPTLDEEINFHNKGYDNYKTFSGHTEGPRYWGKTFFIWPPDPRGPTKDPTNSANFYNNGAKDWRQRFFIKVRNSDNAIVGGVDHNKLLFDSSGVPADNNDYSPTPVMRSPKVVVNVTENNSSIDYYYRINYEAILYWLNQTPKHFPNQIRAGRIKYYDSIPDPTAATGLNNRWWTTRTLTNLNERFWRDYIDFVLGFQIYDTGGGSWAYSSINAHHSGYQMTYVPMSAMIGNGDYFSWGTFQVNQKPDPVASNWRKYTGTVKTAAGANSGSIVINTLGSIPSTNYIVRFDGHPTIYKLTSSTTTGKLYISQNLTAGVALNEAFTIYSQVPRYVDYNDNPYRPRHHYWFGPQTWTDWLMNYNTNRFWAPGTAHEAQCWACKVGVSSAIDDIKKNHPNDFVTMAHFSNPMAKNDDGNLLTGRFNCPQVALGRNYDLLKESLWFPPSTLGKPSSEITPYSTDMDNVPRANGGTAPGAGFTLAYNILSSSVSNLRTYPTSQPTYRGTIGGLGRKGAYRLIIFETDGAPNTRGYSSLVNSGSNSYYPVRIKDPTNLSNSSVNEYFTAGNYDQQEVLDVVTQICKLDTASPPGFGTARRKVKVWSIGYGSLFDPSNTSTAQTNAITFLRDVCVNGNTLATGAAFPSWLRVYGTNTQRVSLMQTAFSNIMQDGVQVTLIE